MVVLVRGDVEVARWSLTVGPCPDLSMLDELARLQLAARRLGCSIRLRDASGQLWGLIDLAGLAEVVRNADGLVPPSALVVEMCGEAEGAEELGVEEGVHGGDPVA
jgi:hypothetical protein